MKHNVNNTQGNLLPDLQLSGTPTTSPFQTPARVDFCMQVAPKRKGHVTLRIVRCGDGGVEIAQEELIFFGDSQPISIDAALHFPSGEKKIK